MKTFKIILWGFIILAIISVFYITSKRIRWENEYKNYAIVVDYPTVYSKINQNDHFTNEALLEQLKERGVKYLGINPGSVAKFRSDLGVPMNRVSGKSGLNKEGLRIPLSEIGKLKDQGFKIALLPGSFSVPDPEILHKYQKYMTELRPSMVIFRGLLPGFPQYGEEWVRFFEGLSVKIGIREFNSLKMAKYLADKGIDNFVRVHQIDAEDQRSLSTKEMLNRILRAVKERNIRAVYLKFFEKASIEENMNFISRLKEKLKKAGFSIGEPNLPDKMKGLKFAILILILGIISLVVISTDRFFGLDLAYQIWGWLSLSVISTVGTFLAYDLTTKVFATSLAIIIPPISFLCLSTHFKKSAPGIIESLRNGLCGLLSFSLLSIIGGVGIGCLLTGEKFFLGLDQFRGVKISYFLPLLLVTWIYFREGGKAKLAKILKSYRGYDLFVLGFLGIIMLVIFFRSGNFSPVPVFKLEEDLRAILENHLYARPRFKEFMLGHPSLLVWSSLPLIKLAKYDIVALVLGMVGQVSIINTFAHLHTPLVFSLFRTINGLSLGMVVGMVCLVLFMAGEKWWKPVKR